jgi:hypothetical protein
MPQSGTWRDPGIMLATSSGRTFSNELHLQALYPSMVLQTLHRNQLAPLKAWFELKRGTTIQQLYGGYAKRF